MLNIIQNLLNHQLIQNTLMLNMHNINVFVLSLFLLSFCFSCSSFFWIRLNPSSNFKFFFWSSSPFIFRTKTGKTNHLNKKREITHISLFILCYTSFDFSEQMSEKWQTTTTYQFNNHQWRTDWIEMIFLSSPLTYSDEYQMELITFSFSQKNSHSFK